MDDAYPKKGKWLHIPLYPDSGENYICSECGYEREDGNPNKDTPFCPNCGARMKGE